MIEYIALVAVFGLIISNILLIRIAFQTKLLEKSEDVFAYTKSQSPSEEAPRKDPTDIVEVPIY